MNKQKTIKDKIVIEGVGLHTGEKVKLTLSPASPNTGIVFFREDKDTLIKADYYSVLSPEKFPRRTSIGNNGVYVHTIEHLMGSLSILGIDNLQVTLNGKEVPGTDGSANVFLRKMKEVGIEEQKAPRKELVVREPVWVDGEKASVVILPSSKFRISYTLDYENPVIPADFLDVTFNSSDDFEKIAMARTFCLEEEVDPLLNLGLGKGADYTNTLVVSKKGVIDNELREQNEFVKHKVLDLLGDLYLNGPIKGHVIAYKSGHYLNIQLLSKLRQYKERISSSGVGTSSDVVFQGNSMNVEEVMKVLPHRYPFLLVDRILHLERKKKVIGIKNVSINDYFFQGHFPNKPVMPGVLIIEAMAQVGGVLMLSPAENRGKLAYFMAADNIKFRKAVEPGDQLVMEVLAGKVKRKTGQVSAKAMVNNKVVAQADLMFILVGR